METILSLQDILLRRGADFTLKIDRLDLRCGTVHVLTGPNGAGKSTLLEVAAALQRPEAGQIVYCGEQLPTRGRRLRVALREITLVGQNPYLFSGSIMDNLAYGLRLRGARGVEQLQRVVQALEEVGLSELIDRQGHELSRGQLQRVALARALVLRPRVLLLDEPTSGFERGFYSSFERIIAGQVDDGVCVVIATHEPDLPGCLNAEVVRLADGRVLGEDRLRVIEGGAARAV